MQKPFNPGDAGQGNDEKGNEIPSHEPSVTGELDEIFSLHLTKEQGMMLLTSARLLDKLVAGVTIHSRSRDLVIKEIIELLAGNVSPEVSKVSVELADAILDSVLGVGEEEDEDLADEFALLSEAFSVATGEDDFFPQEKDVQASLNQDIKDLLRLDELKQLSYGFSATDNRDREAQYIDAAPSYPMYSIDQTFPLIEKALAEHISLEAEYYSFAREAVDRVMLNPLVMLKENNLWRMAAYCHERREILIFRVDRFKSVLLGDKVFEPVNFSQLRYNYNRLPTYT